MMEGEGGASLSKCGSGAGDAVEFGSYVCPYLDGRNMTVLHGRAGPPG